METKDLILGKARFSDWRAMYENVWSHPESARYMLWSVTTNEADARSRMERTIEFQKTHDTYLVYEKISGLAIGFAGVEAVPPDACQEAGICLGPGYVGRGYGRQILEALMAHSRSAYGAKKFFYFTRENNAASKGLAKTMGFRLLDAEEKNDPRNGEPYRQLRYCREL